MRLLTKAEIICNGRMGLPAVIPGGRLSRKMRRQKKAATIFSFRQLTKGEKPFDTVGN